MSTRILEKIFSLNRYIYANDNPMTMSDPTGHRAAYYNGYGIISLPMTTRTPSPAPTYAPAPATPSPPPAQTAPKPSYDYNYRTTEIIQARAVQQSHVSAGAPSSNSPEPPTAPPQNPSSPTLTQSPPKLHYIPWLEQDWIRAPAHEAEIALDLVTVVAAIAMVPSSFLFGTLDRIITATIMTQFIVGIASRNPIQTLWSMVPVLGWMLGQWVAGLSFMTMMSIGFTVVGNVALGVASGGGWLMVRIGYASAVIGSIALGFLGETTMEYNQYKSQ